jgi:hypothetical protein
MRNTTKASSNDTVSLPASISDEDKVIYEAAQTALDGTTEDNPKKTAEVVQAIEKTLNDKTPSNQVYQAINRLSKLPDSRIGSRKGRNGGYFLISKDNIRFDDSDSRPSSKSDKTLERHIWPAAAEWLRFTKNVARVSFDVANKKGGGVWGNPDVVGLSILEQLGFYDVEITTLEVKPSLTNWKYYFFEAVSHKRFSERVYFIFRSTDGIENELRLEVLRYAEKYGVGIVDLQLNDEDYTKLRLWDKLSFEDKAQILDAFVEIAPAPFEPISVRDKINFLEILGLDTKQSLYLFGDNGC